MMYKKFLILFFLVFIGYIAGCEIISHSVNTAFNRINIGDNEFELIKKIGRKPSEREKQDVLFSRYASKPCVAPCVDRLWYENQLSLDSEA